jgi:hypothetical protein
MTNPIQISLLKSNEKVRLDWAGCAGLPPPRGLGPFLAVI